MKVSSINSAPYVRIGPLSRKRASTTPDDFFRKTITTKGWQALCQPPRPAVMSVVREF